MATLPKSALAAKPVRTKSTSPKKVRPAQKLLTVRTSRREPIAAAKAKTHFLQLLDEVARDRQPITITKRGRIVAQLVPAVPTPEISALEQMFGRTAGWMTITGDIVSPDHESWGPEWR